jgi:hypothetical protein
MNRTLYAFLFPMVIAGCGGEKIVLHAQPAQNADINITANEVHVGGKKLWLKLMVQNNSNGTLIVQRDAMTVHLPNGQTLNRAMGTYSTHEPYVITAHAVHPVNIEFEEQGFKWSDVPSAQVDFTNAITKDGQPLAAPPLMVSR